MFFVLFCFNLGILLEIEEICSPYCFYGTLREPLSNTQLYPWTSVYASSMISLQADEEINNIDGENAANKICPRGPENFVL